MIFTWRGADYDMSRYQRIDSPVEPPEPPKLTREEYDKLSRPKKLEYDALMRVYKTYVERKKAAQRRQAQTNAVKPSARAVVAGKVRDLLGPSIKNDEGRTLTQKDFNLMRGGLIALHRTSEELFTKVEDMLNGRSLDAKGKPVTLNNEDRIKTEMLYKLLTENLRTSRKFSEGRGGLSPSQLTEMVEGFEAIDELAEKLDKELISVGQINEFFKRNRINEVIDRDERKKMATVLSQIKESVGADVKRIAKLDPNKLAKTTGGLSTLATTALSSFLGPVGDLVGLVANTEKVSDFIESKGAALWNKLRSRFNLKERTAAKRIGTGPNDDPTATPNAPSQTVPTTQKDPAQQRESQEDVKAQQEQQQQQRTSEKIEKNTEDIVDMMSDEEVEDTLGEFSEAVVDEIKRGVDELGTEVEELLKDVGVENIEKAVREELKPLLDTGHPMGERMVSDIMDILSEPLERQTERLETKLEEVKVEVVKAVEVPRADQKAMGVSANDQADLAERNEKERRSFEDDQQKEDQTFMARQFDRLINIFKPGGIAAQTIGGGGGGGLLSTAAGAIGLTALLKKVKLPGFIRNRIPGLGGVAGGAAAAEGKLGKLATLLKFAKGKKLPGILALLTGGALLAEAASGEDTPAVEGQSDTLMQQKEKDKIKNKADLVNAGTQVLSVGKSFLARSFSKVATPVYAGAEALKTYEDVKDDESLSPAEKTGMVVGSGAGVLAGASAGAYLFGVGAGALTANPIVAGGAAFIGGIVGAIVGEDAVKKAGKDIGTAYDWTRDKASLGFETNINMLKRAVGMSTSDYDPNAEMTPEEQAAWDAGRAARDAIRNSANKAKADTRSMANGSAAVSASPSSASAAASPAPSESPLTSGKGQDARIPASGESEIVSIGKALQDQGYRISENQAFGGVTPGVHREHGHDEGRAIDINTRPGQSPEEMAELDALAAKLQPLVDSGKLRMIWRKRGHFNHMHLEVPKGMESDPELMDALAEQGIIGKSSADDLAAEGQTLNGSAVAEAPNSELTRGEMPNYSPNITVNPPEVNVAQGPKSRGPKAQTPGMRDADFVIDDAGFIIMGSGMS